MKTEEIQGSITMYSTVWCGHCRRLKRQFDEAGLSFSEVDIEEDEAAARRIEQTTGGFRTVPTIEVEGALLVNPTLEDVREALERGSTPL